MFGLVPLPASAGTCPACGGNVVPRRARIGGWRALVEGDCDACGHRILRDLPSGHGLVYPAALDLDTGVTHDPTASEWFAGQLREHWERPDGAPVELSVRGEVTGGALAIADCLDPVYGHA